jgi:predicted ATPase/DNA-binding SARP family transcriptional activator
MRFEVLGPVRVIMEDGTVAALAPRPRTLLAALLAVNGQAVSAERLIAELWPVDAPPTASAALQVHASALRKAVGDRLSFAAGGYAIRAEAVDAAEFEATRDLDLWRGPAYEGSDTGPIVGAAAARLTELLVDARREWVDERMADGRPVLAQLSTWVTAEPTAEPLAQRLMLALHRDGRTADALAVFDRTTAALAELESEPRAELTALAAAVRRRDPTLDRPAPGLPSSRSRFIGRRAELDRAIALSGGTRLLTVVGPGGSGKTRLAYELAGEVTAEYDAVHVVELAGYASGDGLPAARFAAAVGAREEAGGTPLEALVHQLGARRVLLVVDNCEHVRAEAATVVDALLGAAPGVRVLATSREPLGLSGEVVFPLGGLSSADAVRLLSERVTAARGGAGLRPAEQTLAGELARRLDGLPLALELAAARLRALPLAEVMTRLDRRLDLLVGTSPVERHRTMRAAIDWGFDLLDAAQRRLLTELSLFAGRFDLAAASSVHGSDALDPLTQLTDRSMVAFDAGRYRLIETIREYAAELLAVSDPARTRFVDLWAQRLALPPPAAGPAHTEWLAALTAAHDSVIAAIDWSLTSGDPADGLSLAGAMWWYWWITGRMAEGRSWLHRALDATPDTPTTVRAKALRAAATLARNSGDLTAARKLGEQALSAFRTLDDPVGEIAALNGLMITAQGQEDLEGSLKYGYETLALAEATGDARMTAAALNNTASTLRNLDRLDEAAALSERALAAFRAMADSRGEAAVLNNLGIVARRRGRLDVSAAYMRSALAGYVELAIPEGQLDAVEGLAQVEVLAGRPGPGLTLLAVAERERSALGSSIFTPDEVRDRDEAEQRARSALTAEEVAHAYRTAIGTGWDAAVRQCLESGGAAS